MKLPIDYGQLTGAVSSGSEAGSNRIEVTLDADSVQNAGTEGLLTSENLSRMGLLWVSGKYLGVLDGEGNLLNFSVLKYQPTSENTLSGTLTLNIKLESPTNPGDKFLLVGNVFQHGRRLYMEHCMHCHGVSGDGNGPTAPYLNPPPRDYRPGIFKFTSTQQANKANRSDLKRTVLKGIPGTYMPSFLLLKDDELKAIIEYIRWLSIRGEFEKILVGGLEQEEYTVEKVQKRIVDGEEETEIIQELQDYLAEDFIEGFGGINGAAVRLEEEWNFAEDPVNIVLPHTKRPPATPESIARGRALFLSAQAQCALCHGATGKGDGPNTFAYNKKTGTNEEYDEPGLFDDWGNKIKPRDLSKGIYRGGRRPLDIYRRIHSSIKGTPMPAFGTALTVTDPQTGKKDDQQIWDLVNYVLNRPFEDR
jgi:mono/diheme cytochrome c family protein